MLLGILGNGRAVNILHYDVGQPVFRGAAVEQAGDVWVLQSRQSLPLAAEAGEDELRIHPGPDQLDRHLGVVLVVITLSQKYPAHTAASQLADQSVGTNPGWLWGSRINCVK